MTASDYFNVFTAEYAPLAGTTFGAAESRVLCVGLGGRLVVMATRFPEGGKFTFAPSGYEEVFYISSGTGTRSLPGGEKLEMKAGDFIYVRPDVDVEYEIDPGFTDVALFWSDTPLDPELIDGLLVQVDT